MRANLEKLKETLQPTTAEERRASMVAYERTLDEPEFVYALEFEMRHEVLATADRILRQRALAEAQQLLVA